MGTICHPHARRMQRRQARDEPGKDSDEPDQAQRATLRPRSFALWSGRVNRLWPEARGDTGPQRGRGICGRPKAPGVAPALVSLSAAQGREEFTQRHGSASVLWIPI